VRAKVEPALEAWAASVLGPASRVRVRVNGAASDLSTRRLSALDVLAMNDAQVEQAFGDGLVSDRDPAWPAGSLTLPEFLEVAHTVRELLASARPLDARDLSLPGPVTDPGVDAADLAARTAIATGALADARTKLSGGQTAPGLAKAARLGVSGPVAAVQAELDRRAKALAAATTDPARVAAVLGDGFRLLPKVAAPDLSASTDLQDGDPLAAVTWLQRAAHVRDGASRLEEALLYGEAGGGAQPLRLRVAQLPRATPDHWVGLPGLVAGGKLSLVVQTTATTAAAKVSGLVVDEWTEVVPDATQMTGLSFHVPQPAARAPQAILLAVAPDESHVWSLNSLEATVLDSFDLAQTRLVDGEALATAPPNAPRLGQYLPAAYLASAPAELTVTSDLTAVVSG
jgi:hypothetical protein